MTWDEAFNLAIEPMLMAKGRKPRLVQDRRKRKPKPAPELPLSDKARAVRETERLRKMGLAL